MQQLHVIPVRKGQGGKNRESQISLAQDQTMGNGNYLRRRTMVMTAAGNLNQPWEYLSSR